jgi:hypothetical protein
VAYHIYIIGVLQLIQYTYTYTEAIHSLTEMTPMSSSPWKLDTIRSGFANDFNYRAHRCTERNLRVASQPPCMPRFGELGLLLNVNLLLVGHER